MLPTFCPPTIWTISLEFCRKPSILAADDFLGACYRKAMTPKKLWTLLFGEVCRQSKYKKCKCHAQSTDYECENQQSQQLLRYTYLRWAEMRVLETDALACRNARFKNTSVSKWFWTSFKQWSTACRCVLKNASVSKNGLLNVRIQWNAGTACVSECVLKTLACRGLRVGPSMLLTAEYLCSRWFRCFGIVQKRPFVHNSVCSQFLEGLFAILAECSQFCLRSF